MFSLETIQSTSRSIDSADANPRISFSADPGESSSGIGPKVGLLGSLGRVMRAEWPDPEKPEFEFLSAHSSLDPNILTADELFSEGKLLPFWQAHHSDSKPAGIATLRTRHGPEGEAEERTGQGQAAAAGEDGPGQFVDDNPSPRPPKCTVLWKELLRLRNRPIPADVSAGPNHDKKEPASGSGGDRDKDANKRAKKGLERTRSGTLRIRPMINVPICSTMKASSNYAMPPPLFPTRKGRLER